MSIKLMIDPVSDAILGAQIIGGEGVDRRVDIIAVAMAGSVTASRLAELELAYAPQFGSAKDPINHLGYVAENLRSGTTRSVQWHQLAKLREHGAALIDVRSRDEYLAGNIPGSLSIPLDELRARVAELPVANLVVHCQVGQRGHTASRMLTQLGYDVANLDGGYRTWVAGMSATRELPGP